MKNIKLLTTILLTASTLALTACGHEHTWAEATCTTPKMCECGEVEGEANGHTWIEANCETAKTCSVCEITDGEPLGHTWVDATCTTAKICNTCQEADGEPLGHEWIEATCTVPKHCIKCNIADGETAPHKWIEATTEYPKTCESCGQTEGEPLPKPVDTQKPEVQKPVTQQPEVQHKNPDPEWTLDTGVSKEDWDSFFDGGNTTGQHTWTPNYGDGVVIDNDNRVITGSGLSQETLDKSGNQTVH